MHLKFTEADKIWYIDTTFLFMAIRPCIFLFIMDPLIGPLKSACMNACLVSSLIKRNTSHIPK